MHRQPAQETTSANSVPLFFNISIYDHKCHQQNWELKLHSEGGNSLCSIFERLKLNCKKSGLIFIDVYVTTRKTPGL